MAKGGYLNCIHIRDRQDVEHEQVMDHLFGLLKRNDRKRRDREMNEAWDDHDANGVVRGRRRR